eukprot:193302-Pleurochrysis_carterae.AAC.4
MNTSHSSEAFPQILLAWFEQSRVGARLVTQVTHCVRCSHTYAHTVLSAVQAGLHWQQGEAVGADHVSGAATAAASSGAGRRRARPGRVDAAVGHAAHPCAQPRARLRARAPSARPATRRRARRRSQRRNATVVDGHCGACDSAPHPLAQLCATKGLAYELAVAANFAQAATESR